MCGTSFKSTLFRFELSSPILSLALKGGVRGISKKSEICVLSISLTSLEIGRLKHFISVKEGGFRPPPDRECWRLSTLDMASCKQVNARPAVVQRCFDFDFSISYLLLGEFFSPHGGSEFVHPVDEVAVKFTARNVSVSITSHSRVRSSDDSTTSVAS